MQHHDDGGMRKCLLMIMAVVILASCETFKIIQRDLASVKPKHYIITLHGLSDTPEAFMGLLIPLRSHLEQINPSFEYVGLNFKYSTGDKGANTDRFVSEFENFLMSEIPLINENDKISLVTHSQGGLVGLLWYLKAVYGVDLRQQSYMARVDGFITLGTPFWGSRTAYLLKKYVPNKEIQDFIFDKNNLSDGEITDLASASEKIYDFYKQMMKRTSVNIIHDPRLLNLIAVVPETKGEELPEEYFSRAILGIKRGLVKTVDHRLNQGLRWESDQAVNVSSGRLGFYYFSDDIYEYMEKEKRTNVIKDDFNSSRFFKTDAKVVFVEGAHAKASSYDLAYSIAAVPEECREPMQCRHVSYVHILKHLANCENSTNMCLQNNYRSILQTLEAAKRPLSLETSDMIHKEMRTYNLAFDIELPKNFVPPKELLDEKTLMNYFQVNNVNGTNERKHFANLKTDGLIKNSSQLSYEIRLARRKEWGSRIVNYTANKNKLNIQLTGNVSPVNDKVTWDVTRDYPLQMIINIPGLKKRTLVIPVRPTYTTFLDLKLD